MQMSLDIYLDIAVDTGGEHLHDIRLWSGNATHNLGPMWREAGIRDALYNRAGSFAGSILPELRRGLQDMEARPDVYRAMDPPNKWGDYDGAVRFLRELIEACKKHPRATIGIWA